MALEGDGQVPPWLGDHEPWAGDATGQHSPHIPGCRSIPAHHFKTNPTRKRAGPRESTSEAELNPRIKDIP